MMVTEAAKLGRPCQRSDHTSDGFNDQSARFQLLDEPIARPAPKVSGMRMIEPYAMRRQHQPAIVSQQPFTFAQVPVQVPNVLQHLKRHDNIRRLVGQRQWHARLEANLRAESGGRQLIHQITGGVFSVPTTKKFTIWRRARANIKDLRSLAVVAEFILRQAFQRRDLSGQQSSRRSSGQRLGYVKQDRLISIDWFCHACARARGRE